MSELERIARAIDPKAWLPLYDHDIDGWWYDRRRDSLSAAVRVQELLRERDEWMLEAMLALRAASTIGRREGTHLHYANQDRLVEQYEQNWSTFAALGVAEQPEGRVS